MSCELAHLAGEEEEADKEEGEVVEEEKEEAQIAA